MLPAAPAHQRHAPVSCKQQEQQQEQQQHLQLSSNSQRCRLETRGWAAHGMASAAHGSSDGACRLQWPPHPTPSVLLLLCLRQHVNRMRTAATAEHLDQRSTMCNHVCACSCCPKLTSELCSCPCVCVRRDRLTRRHTALVILAQPPLVCFESRGTGIWRSFLKAAAAIHADSSLQCGAHTDRTCFRSRADIEH